MTLADVDRITTVVLGAASRGDVPDPTALTFLLRQYRVTGRADVSEALGEALARALARYTDHQTTVERAAWLRAFTEAAALSDDARLVEAARDLIDALTAEWPSGLVVHEAAVSVDACLYASDLVDPHAAIPRAIDELERIVAGAYQPGHGVGHTIEANARGRGELRDQVRTASALLTAFELTGRLPYSMLAEELMQTANEALGAGAGLVDACEAARVLCRLAALHDDASYRGAAVIAVDADYRAQAAQLLAGVSGQMDAPADAALYGLAVEELRSVWPTRESKG